MRSADSIMAANKGTLVINDTTTVTGVFSAVYVLSDTVFNTLTDSNGNTKGSYITAVGTAVKAGAFIRPIDGCDFSTIKLTSGSVVAVK